VGKRRNNKKPEIERDNALKAPFLEIARQLHAFFNGFFRESGCKIFLNTPQFFNIQFAW
jgi:hypothetical protein